MIKKITSAFLWLYPLLFLIDGSLSVIDDSISYFLPVKMLNSVRSIFAQIVYFSSILYIFNLFLYETKKQLPYWLTPIFNVAFTILSTMSLLQLISGTSLFEAIALSMSPHYIYSKHPWFFMFSLFASISQVAIGFYSFKYTWNHRHEVERKELKLFSATAASSSFIGLFIFTNIFAAVAMFATSSSGFIDFQGDKVVSVEKVFEKNGKIVHLIPMIHIGSETFYKEFAQLEPTKKTLILLEGVKDEKNLIGHISYRQMASSVGLSAQEDKFSPKAKTKELQKNISYIVADVDASDFSPETRKLINKMLKDMNEKSFFELMFSGYDTEGFSDDLSHISVDIIERRNQKVLMDLAANEAQYEEFYIPWGAAHLPDIEKNIQRLGYKEVSRKERAIASLNDIFK